MKLRRRFAAALVVPAAALAAGLAAAGTAHASVGPVSFTPAGTASISGYYAHAENDTIDFSHLATREGSDGDHTIEQLPTSTVSPTVHIRGEAGIALCNQATGKAAQLGLVNAGGGLVDIVATTGTLGIPFGQSAANNGDLCQDGIVNPDGHNTGYEHSAVVATGIPDNNSVDLDILYDPADAFTFGGHHFSAGTVVFAATNLGAPGVSMIKSENIHGFGVTYNEADAGVISDTTHVVPLPGTPPYPNPGGNSDPQLLEGFSHTQADGNSVLPGGTEVHGSFYNNNAWSAFPVASSKSGKVYLGPTIFSEDHFLELVGSPVS